MTNLRKEILDMPKEPTINWTFDVTLSVILFGIIAMLAILPACCTHQPQIEMPVGPTFQYHDVR